MGCQRFFLKRRENVMFSNKIDLPYGLVVFFVVCPRLRPFWSVFGELACFWCSTAKIKTRQHRDFRSNQECPSLEAKNSAGKLPPASIPRQIQSRDVAVPCPITRFAIPPTDRSLALLLSLARSASQFRIRLVQTAVDPEIWFINGVDHRMSEWTADEGLTLETSILHSLYGGQFTFINSVDKPNFRFWVLWFQT